MKYLIVLFALCSTPLLACEFERGAVPYVGLGAGWSGNFTGTDPVNENELAALFNLGIRFPMSLNWGIDAKWTHNSWFFTSADADESRDILTLGFEYQFK